MATAKKSVAAKTANPKAADTKASKTTALAKWDEALAAKAQKAKKVVAAIGGGAKNVLSFKGGRLTYQGGQVPGNKLNVVVLSAINENNYFAGAYDPNNPAAPTCYAFGSPDGEDENMGPNKEHFKGHESDVQSETGRCADCQHNEWGSADTGRGKACKNIVALAMVPADLLDDLDALEKAEVVYAKLPVTSGKNWKGLVQSCGDSHYIQFVVELSVEPAGEFFIVNFETVSEVPRAAIGTLLTLSDKEDEKWGSEPYPVFEQPEPKRGARRVIPVKAAGRGAVKPAAKPRKY